MNNHTLLPPEETEENDATFLLGGISVGALLVLSWVFCYCLRKFFKKYYWCEKCHSHEVESEENYEMSTHSNSENEVSGQPCPQTIPIIIVTPPQESENREGCEESLSTKSSQEQ